MAAVNRDSTLALVSAASTAPTAQLTIERIGGDGADGAVAFRRWFRALRARKPHSGHAADAAELQNTVSELLAAVERGGESALAHWVPRIEGLADGSWLGLQVEQSTLNAARQRVDQGFVDLMRRAAASVRAYQQHIRVEAPPPLLVQGRELGVRYTPVEAVGVYVPGGRAIYPSSVIMSVVPAQVAGVKRIVIASPPQQATGEVAESVLALASLLGVDEVVRLGGALAVGALAFGTESLPPVDMVVGPGNAYVAEAKRQVSGRVGIDAIAGPSEVVVVADASTPPAWAAAELLAQAEHDPGVSILITSEPGVLDAVHRELGSMLPQLSRRSAIAASLERYGLLLQVSDSERVSACVNAFAPEHLALLVTDPTPYLDTIHHAGAIFAGLHSPVAFGDYLAGPSHVLPTEGSARFSGPLSCNAFLKATSIVRYTREGCRAQSDDGVAFASIEGLTAHAESIRMRG